MTDTPDQRLAALRPAFDAAGQGHLFAFVDQLGDAERTRLADQLDGVDLDLIARLGGEMKSDAPVATLDLGRLEPPPVISLGRDEESQAAHKAATERGVELLRQGKVAAFVVAGGQGTRLGFDGPKGCFPIGPVTGCSLFEWHFAKVAAARRRYQADLPMLVMTSRANHDATERFLRDHDFFGIPERDVILFSQGMLPAVDGEGRILMESTSSLALAPDGHGGSLLALRERGVLDELATRGIEEIYYFQVDNPLARVLEPAFLGHHHLAGAEMSSKMVPKRNAGEKVGVFARSGGKVGIVEYSDLPDDLAAATDDDGALRYRAGNIAIHAIRTDFVRRLTEGGLKLPYHRANKAVAHVDASGNAVTPSSPNAVKFETFVFDALPLAETSLVIETDRQSEFSPVKNKSGDDSAETAKRDLCRMFRGWIEDAGYGITKEMCDLEISPSYALDADEFADRLKHQKLFPGNRLIMA